MSRNSLKPSPRPKSSGYRRVPSGRARQPWMWLVAGVLVGGLTMYGVTTYMLRPAVREAPIATPPTAAVRQSSASLRSSSGATATAPVVGKPAPAARVNSEASETADMPASVKPRFDFYTLLRESEVIVPDAQETERLPPRPTEVGYRYLLQAGSFKSDKDAESRRAQLILLNLQTSVEVVNSRPGETWHRVLVGPFDAGDKLAAARAALFGAGIDHLLLKRKK